MGFQYGAHKRIRLNPFRLYIHMGDYSQFDDMEYLTAQTSHGGPSFLRRLTIGTAPCTGRRRTLISQKVGNDQRRNAPLLGFIKLFGVDYRERRPAVQVEKVYPFVSKKKTMTALAPNAPGS
ncbi:9007_t:CDS:2 [Paraglomus occultum]|uniref:9007_t:CDS:1 n=1 Tax=Paraglomus occultum TaxID=144539 RepID=A0A9N9A301_9GLOM|nr:9007_t:CDS:2 [Paraglomus occultum]